MNNPTIHFFKDYNVSVYKVSCFFNTLSFIGEVKKAILFIIHFTKPRNIYRLGSIA